MRTLLLAAGFAALGFSAAGQERSVVTVPMSIELDGLAAYANARLPAQLHRHSGGQRCVEPQQACTKVPEFRGLKMTMKNRCVQVSPGIDCHLDQRVWRDGPMSISGRGDTIILQQAVRAQATVRGRGEIGRHIRETANGAAHFTVSAKPGIARDWRILLPLDVRFRWTERPNVVLANVFRVTFGGEAERQLNRAIDQFKTQTLPAELARIDVKSRIAPLWSQLQDPIRLDTGAGAPLWLHFRPEAVGMASLRVSGGQLATAASIAGRMRVTDRKASPFAGPRTRLPNLGPAMPDGLSVVVQATVSIAAMTKALNAELPRRLGAKSPIEGQLQIRSASAESVAGRLILTLDVIAELAGFDTYSGKIAVSGVPAWSPSDRTLVLRDPKAQPLGSGLSQFALNAILRSAPFRKWLTDAARFPMADALRKAETALNKALNRQLTPAFRLTGSAKVSIREVRLQDHLHVALQAVGAVRVEGVKLR